VAVVDAVSGTASAFRCEGVVTIAKTSALAISVGDRLFWDPAAKVVNKTTTAQQQVGIAVEAATNPSGTVKMLLESALPVAT
jgi:predicted RecA/RadA family phage recombinase